MHILIAIPSPENVNNEFALGNLPEIVNRTKREFPDIKISIAHHVGVRTDANRNHILKEALKDKTIDYILWLDSDMIYPAEIIVRYLDSVNLGQKIDVIGCLYFKRSYPYQPIAYEFNDGEDKNIKPYKTILPSAIKDDTIYEVDGLGYGGMMVSMDVYEKLGDKKWTVYGSNFHLPFDSEDHMTHDLVFCKDVKEAGMSVKLHGGVRPGHISSKIITYEDWQKATEDDFAFKKVMPSVLVIMPTLDVEQGKLAADVMRARAGADFDIAVVEDNMGFGFIRTVNEVAKAQKHEIIIYTAQDALVGQNWLKHALIKMMTTNAGLVGFNDGKWNGELASFGMVQRSWVKDIYSGNILNPEYNAHYADTELTQIAKQQGRYAYAEKSIMMEVDFKKAVGKGKGTVKADKKLYKKRKKDGFGGLVTSPDLINQFS